MDEKQLGYDKDSYIVIVRCSNCNYVQEDMKISRGKRVSHTPCPNCDCEALRLKYPEKKKNKQDKEEEKT